MTKPKSSSLFVVGLASMLSRLSGLLTQFVMAWYLVPSDYGLWAIVLGITTFTTIFRGGGTSNLFQTMRPEEFSSKGGGLFYYSMIFGLLGAVLTLGAALPSQFLYPPESIRGLGWILFYSSIQFILFTASNYPRAMMASKLMFTQIAAMDITAATAKFGVAFYCASHGYGALSFVLSVLANSFVVLAWSLVQSGLSGKELTTAPNWITETLALVKFPFLIAIVNSLGSQPDLFIASFFIPVSTLGIYLFANQMAIQPVQLLSGALQNVLAPYAARIRGHDESENEHIRRTFLSSIVFVPIFVMGIAAVYPSMVHLMFLDRWVESILPVMFASIFLIYPTVQMLLEGTIIGARRWKLTLRLFLSRAIAKIIGALVAVGAISAFDIPKEYVSLALILGVGIAASLVAFLQIHKLSEQIHLERNTFSYEIYSTPLYAVLAAVATSGLAYSIVDMLGISSGINRIEAFLSFVLSMTTYVAVSLVLLRFGYIENLHQLLVLIPGKARTRLYKLLVLENPNASRSSDTTASSSN